MRRQFITNLTINKTRLFTTIEKAPLLLNQNKILTTKRSKTKTIKFKKLSLEIQVNFGFQLPKVEQTHFCARLNTFLCFYKESLLKINKHPTYKSI